MDLGQGIDHGVIHRLPLARRQVGQLIAAKHPALDKIHKIKVHAQHRRVLTQHVGFGDRHLGLPQGRDDPELPVNRVGRGQQLAGRFLAQDIPPAGRVGQDEGRVRHAAPDLPDRQRRTEGFNMLGHVARQCGLVETMLVKHRRRLSRERGERAGLYGLGCRHGASLLLERFPSSITRQAVSSRQGFSRRGWVAHGRDSPPAGSRHTVRAQCTSSGPAQNTPSGHRCEPPRLRH